MHAPVVSTKLLVPSLHPNLVDRPQLVARLNTGLRQGHRLTLLAAPAGFGKTTLVGAWTRQLDRPIAWLSLSYDDNDPIRFLGCLAGALRHILCSIGRHVRDVLASEQLPSLESQIIQLIDDIAETALPCLLVLDDLHVIQTPRIYELIELLLEHQPPALHLALLTRADPPLMLPRLRAADQMTEMHADDLRFTTDEIAAFFTQTHGLSLAPPLVDMLEAWTEGWIAGLQLAALSIRGRPDSAAAVRAFSGSHRYVSDYLATEVLQQQPEDLWLFLRQTSILEHLSAPLCEALLKIENDQFQHMNSQFSILNSQLLLERLERANLFITPLDERREWYRYHPLFAEFLRSTLATDELRRLHRRAARWYSAHGSIHEAVTHALAADDLNTATHMVSAAASQAIEQGELTTLLHWLEALPDGQVRASLDLATYKGWVLWLTGQSVAAKEYARSAEASLLPDAPPPSRGRLVALQSFLTSASDTQTLQHAQAALALLGPHEPFFRCVTLLRMAYIWLARGDTAAAQAAFDEVVQLAQQRGLSFTAAIGLHELALAGERQGKRRMALAVCRRAIDQLVGADGQPLPVACGLYLTAGRLNYAANQLSEARHELETGLALAQKLGLALASLSGKADLARLLAAFGETEAALNTIAEAQAMVAQANLLGWAEQLAAVAAELQLRQGSLAAGVRWAEAVSISEHFPACLRRDTAYRAYVRLLLAQQRPREALDLLAKMEHWERTCAHDGHIAAISALQALAHQALGHEQQMLVCLEQAVALAAPEDERRIFLDIGPSIIALLPLARHIAPIFVDRVVSDSGIHGAAPPQQLVEPLSEREREIVRLIAAGLTNEEAAAELVIAPGTVKKHLDHIYGKLGVHRRTQAVARARELHLV